MPGTTGIAGSIAVLFWAVGELLFASATADCPRVPVTSVSELRSGLVADGQYVTLEGVATGVFTGRDRLGGFFVQQEAPPLSGIFVYAPSLSAEAVRPGDRVQLTGRFNRFQGRPQVSRVDGLRVCAHVGLPDPVAVRLPRDAARLPSLQGLKVRFDQTLTVTGNYELGRYGSLHVAAEGRLYRVGEIGEAGAGSRRVRQIVIDDGSYRTDPTPIPYLDASGTRRAGDQVEGLTGILTYAFGAHRVHPTRMPVFVPANPRAAPPGAIGNTVRVATLNVENYFLSLGQRGARDRAQRDRQRQKLTAAVHGIDADVLSLVEVENREAALADLVETLNRNLPSQRRYRAVPHPLAGADAIRNVLLYRPARVSLVEAAADPDPVHNRPPLLAWFTLPGGRVPVGIVSVHFKSKVGCPETGDIDRGQGCWNQLRREQGQRLLKWLAEVRIGDAPVLIAGDLNAYAHEDPMLEFRLAGKQDLVSRNLPAAHRYTYVFHGEAGQLDYLLAPQELTERVVSAGVWHINADEPAFLRFAGRSPAPGPWRSSDHDPVWADLRW